MLISQLAHLIYCIIKIVGGIALLYFYYFLYCILFFLHNRKNFGKMLLYGLRGKKSYTEK